MPFTRLPLAFLFACAALPAVAQPGFDPTRELAQGASGSPDYCGSGGRVGVAVNALDRACMHHDACAPGAMAGQQPRCGCNRRLVAEAARVARDPRQPADLRVQAQRISDGTRLLSCR